jgi:hypothetical protein
MGWTSDYTKNLEREDSRIRSLQELHRQKGNWARIGISGLEDGSESAIFEDDVIKLYDIRGRHVGLYKKGRIRVQVIIKDRRFSLFSRIVTSHIRVELMFRVRV